MTIDRSASAKIPDQLIGQWDLPGKSICLFRETNRLSFSTTGLTGKRSSFTPKLYDLERATWLVQKFHHTIGVNLEREECHSSCFLPVLCLPVQNAPEKTVALFGRVDTTHHPEGEVKWLRYGIIEGATSQSFEAKNTDSIFQNFIKNAPSANQQLYEPVLDKKNSPILDKRGQPVLQESVNSYAMNTYAKRFCVQVEKEESQRVKNVALCYLSQIDGKTPLNEDHWAVTLVSGKVCTGLGLFTRIFRGVVGHALLACEGVRDGKPFLEYVHLTQEARTKLPGLKSDEGQIEHFATNTPLDTINGPTWSRSKTLVENMFAFVQKELGKPIKFAFYRPVFPDSDTLGIVFRNELIHGTPSGTEILAHCRNLAEDPKPKEKPLNCLNFAVNLAEYAGIIFYGHVNGTTPLRKIEIIKSHPHYQIPEGLHEFLGRSLYPRRKDVIDGMLSACVVLAPRDCPSQELWRWGLQTALEETWATDREIDRVNDVTSVSISEIWGGYTPKRWT